MKLYLTFCLYLSLFVIMTSILIQRNISLEYLKLFNKTIQMTLETDKSSQNNYVEQNIVFNKKDTNKLNINDSAYAHRQIEKIDDYNYNVKISFFINVTGRGLARISDTLPCSCDVKLIKFSDSDGKVYGKTIRFMWLFLEYNKITEIEYSVKCKEKCDISSIRGYFIYHPQNVNKDIWIRILKK